MQFDFYCTFVRVITVVPPPVSPVDVGSVAGGSGAGVLSVTVQVIVIVFVSPIFVGTAKVAVAPGKGAIPPVVVVVVAGACAVAGDGVQRGGVVAGAVQAVAARTGRRGGVGLQRPRAPDPDKPGTDREKCFHRDGWQ